jgi:argininosuccinate lyase
MLAAISGDFSTATDLADYLVRQGLPFRQAHEVVGKVVQNCLQRNRPLEQLSSEDLVSFSPLFRDAPADIAGILHSVESRNVPGGVAREAVLDQLRLARAAVTTVLR